LIIQDYIFALTRDDSVVLGWSDLPCYGEDVTELHVIKVSLIDEVTWTHLTEDPSRCLIEEKSEILPLHDDFCPIKIDGSKGIYYSSLRYCNKQHLTQEKFLKEQELAHHSEEAIRKGFEFEFSPDNVAIIPFDETAQKNLQATIQLFEKGTIQSIPWTVNRIGGNTERVMLTKEMSEGLAITAMLHTHVNIARFRDQLMPMVSHAESLEELESIKWDLPEIEKRALRGFPQIERCFEFIERNKIHLGGLTV